MHFFLFLEEPGEWNRNVFVIDLWILEATYLKYSAELWPGEVKVWNASVSEN